MQDALALKTYAVLFAELKDETLNNESKRNRSWMFDSFSSPLLRYYIKVFNAYTMKTDDKEKKLSTA